MELPLVANVNRSPHNPSGQSVIVGKGGKCWRLISKIGSGTFGGVYMARDESNGEEVAVKIEPAHQRTLQNESKVYRAVAELAGFPRVHFVNTSSENHCIVMDLLGPSLEELFQFCSRRFSLVTVLLLAEAMLQRLESLHQRGWLHRDVKPGNFLMGTGRRRRRLYLIDFGLSKMFYDYRRQAHMPPSGDYSRLVGTCRFASIHMHRGLTASRRDDLESFCYCLLYFLKSRLPWQGVRAPTKKQKMERVGELKASISVESLCSGLPPELAIVLHYCRGLLFAETPDYEFIYTKLQCLRDSLMNCVHTTEPTDCAVPKEEKPFITDWEAIRLRVLQQTD